MNLSVYKISISIDINIKVFKRYSKLYTRWQREYLNDWCLEILLTLLQFSNFYVRLINFLPKFLAKERNEKLFLKFVAGILSLSFLTLVFHSKYWVFNIKMIIKYSRIANIQYNFFYLNFTINSKNEFFFSLLDTEQKDSIFSWRVYSNIQGVKIIFSKQNLTERICLQYIKFRKYRS